MLAALNPLRRASRCCSTVRGVALAIIGAVFLAMTGGEALYADMGHFGKQPVRIAWFALVCAGAGDQLFRPGRAAARARPPGARMPLYHLVPAQLLPLMVVLATAAAVIASQATISGAFSVARQACSSICCRACGCCRPRPTSMGQIYVPVVNWLVFPAVVLFVVGFGSSDALGGAYGAAVVGTMFVTTILGAFVAATQWNWPTWQVGALFGLMLVTDCVFVAGNLTKVPDGGWVPLTLGGGAVPDLHDLAQRARWSCAHALAKLAVPRSELASCVAGVHRVPGTGVFLASNANLVPSALIRNIEHNCVVHERIIILNVEIADTPRQDPVRPAAHRGAGAGRALHHARASASWRPRMSARRSRPAARAACGCSPRTARSSSAGTWCAPRPLPGCAGLQRRLFARMQQYSTQAAEFFRMPFRDVVILNTAVEI